MPIGDPRGLQQQRMARMQMLYPELTQASPSQVLGVDAFRLQQGQAPSDFAQCVMRLAARAAQEKASR